MPKTKQAESLFVIAEQTGQIVDRSFEEQPFPSVPLVERAAGLQNVITKFADINRLKHYVASASPGEDDERTEEILKNSKVAIRNDVAAAEEEFRQATGHYSLVGLGMTDWEADRVTKGLYTEFLLKYARPKDYKAAQAYRRKLSREVDAFSATKPLIQPAVEFVRIPSLDDQTSPEDVKQSAELVSGMEQPKPQDQKLSNFEKLEALVTDPRAGFLPTCNLEKNLALTWLSYLDKPGATAGQLLEVYHKAQRARGAGAVAGLRAVLSLTEVSADFAKYALASQAQLEELQAGLAEVMNPRLTLDRLEEITDMSGLVSLLRYSQIKQFYQQRPEKVPHYLVDPLRTHEDRWAAGNDPGKHKIVGGRLSNEAFHDQEEVNRELADFMTTTTVQSARRMVSEAISNETSRARFFTERVDDVALLSRVSKIFDGVAGLALQKGRSLRA